MFTKSVQLRTPRGPIGWGQICNVSLSGAFVESSIVIPTLSQVQVVFAKDHPREPLRIEAQVVRRTPVGIGLEWDEFGGEPIRALMASLERRSPFTPTPVHVNHVHPARPGRRRASF